MAVELDDANTAADHVDAMKKHMNLERNYKFEKSTIT